MDVVNFAHGELLMLAMYATFVLWLTTGLDPLLLLIPVALALFALGVAIYHLLIERALSVRFNRGMVQISVTFSLAILLRGVAQFTFGSDFKSVSISLLANRTIVLGGVFRTSGPHATCT
jgi:branched-chain amino acid transport system permease protein